MVWRYTKPTKLERFSLKMMVKDIRALAEGRLPDVFFFICKCVKKMTLVRSGVTEQLQNTQIFSKFYLEIKGQGY